MRRHRVRATLVPVSGRWQTTVAAEPSALAGLRRSVEQQARDAGVSADQLFSVGLAVHELVVNAMEHGYGWDASEVVDVSAWRERGEFVVSVHDTGSWRPARETPGRGLGLRLARELSRSVSVATGGDGSTVVLRVGLEAAPLARQES
jgi:two-component sensor histidine kinase